ncbi:DUF4440 domain-containing protein [Aquimarina celericrescens]|uniref:DUF4440 domain-containing protein n=1 Tax=Aquimarina celericrescens TaxID=1964542 RepID=A0ABW5AZ01_9FLAO|nr:DUF4440 domain-containing protein [Aquimarina celericrescens]
MISKINFKSIVLTFIFTLFSSHLINSQSNTDNQNLETTILKLDNEFWESYNTCDLDKFRTFFIEDFEFYHDKGGLTSGLSQMMKSVETGLCGTKNPRVRREVVEGSVHIYPLNNYGAIINGNHKFFVTEKGKKEVLTEIAKFTPVWQHKNDEWKMTRVLSYDHQHAPQNTNKKEASLTDNILMQYIGTYQAPDTGTVTVSKKDNLLEINAEKMQATIYPQSESLFFHKQSPLTFEFIKDVNNKVIKFIVRENGNIVEEAKKVK